MKRLLALALSIASITIGASPAEAKATGSSISPTTIIAANTAAPQFERQDRRGRQDRWGRRNNHRVRTMIRTRYVSYGRRLFRETYLIRFLPRGRVETVLISRVRVR